jgi:hypothetical protein
MQNRKRGGGVPTPTARCDWAAGCCWPDQWPLQGFSSSRPSSASSAAFWRGPFITAPRRPSPELLATAAPPAGSRGGSKGTRAGALTDSGHVLSFCNTSHRLQAGDLTCAARAIGLVRECARNWLAPR